MARSSSRSSLIGTSALLLALLAGATTSAHRRDEYLQAARIAIDPDRVEVELDLTAGIAVAQEVLAQIDLDRNGVVSSVEAHAYSARVLSAIAVDVDGVPLALGFADSTFPSIDAVMNGEGMARIRASASMPRLAAGRHQLRFRNAHRPDIGVYLANALVPVSDRVAVTAQQRDVDQRELIIAYTLREETAMSAMATYVLKKLSAVWYWKPSLRAKPGS